MEFKFKNILKLMKVINYYDTIPQDVVMEGEKQVLLH